MAVGLRYTLNSKGKPCPKCKAGGWEFTTLTFFGKKYESCIRCGYSKGHARYRYKLTGSLMHAIRRMLGGK